MSKAMQALKDFLTVSPSVVYPDEVLELLQPVEHENEKLRELFSKVYGYYVSGTLKPCDFCDKYCCEGDAPTTCKSDEYDPDGIVVDEVERLMRELGMEV